MDSITHIEQNLDNELNMEGIADKAKPFYEGQSETILSNLSKGRCRNGL
ncbi:hypothetical protein [Sporosarcina sp. A2]